MRYIEESQHDRLYTVTRARATIQSKFSVEKFSQIAKVARFSLVKISLVSVPPLPGFLLLLRLTLFHCSSVNGVTCSRVNTYNVSGQVSAQNRVV